MESVDVVNSQQELYFFHKDLCNEWSQVLRFWVGISELVQPGFRGQLVVFGKMPKPLPPKQSPIRLSVVNCEVLTVYDVYFSLFVLISGARLFKSLIKWKRGLKFAKIYKFNKEVIQ